MKVFRIIFRILVLLGLATYLWYAFANFTGKGDATPCEQVNVRINEESLGFIHTPEISKMLHEEGCYPVGVAMERINGKLIEKGLLKNPYIEDVVCYKSPGGMVNILIEQRIPVLRVLAENGDDYYVSDEGDSLSPMHYTGNFLVATGNITPEFATTHLRTLANYITKHDFWNTQIEQVHVAPDQKIVLYPRVGKQKIKFGRIEKIETKFDNLKLFYDKVMPVVGWNKYKELNIAHINQVIGTR